MPRRTALLLALPLALAAQEDPFSLDLPPPASVTRVAVGGYDQAFSDGLGHWKGWLADGTVYPAEGGPWELAATGFDRTEGTGAMLSVGKYLLLGKTSSIFVGLGAGTNRDFLPQWRAEVDAHLALGSGWHLDVGGAFNQFTQGESIRMLQAGPAYQARSWSLSAKLQQLAYSAGGDDDLAGILTLRLGGDDFGRWHALRLAAGRGIIESYGSGGSLTGTATRFGSGGRFGNGAPAPSPGLPTATSTPLPQERMASLTGHWPLTGTFALRAEARWGEAVATYRFWGGSLQVIATF